MKNKKSLEQINSNLLNEIHQKDLLIKSLRVDITRLYQQVNPDMIDNGYTIFVEYKENNKNKLTISHSEKRISIKISKNKDISEDKLVKIAKKVLAYQLEKSKSDPTILQTTYRRNIKENDLYYINLKGLKNDI